MSRRRNAPRDTAKDIILGMPPSGAPPRQPREGINILGKPKEKRAQIAPVMPIVSTTTNNTDEINRLQDQLRDMQRQHDQMLNAEQEARRRIEANQEALQRRLAAQTDASASGAISSHDIDDLRNLIASLESKMLVINNELQSLKGTVDRHNVDLLQMRNNRPDQSRFDSSTQQVELRFRDLQDQLAQMRQLIDRETKERMRVEQAHNENSTRLQDYIRRQDTSKNEILYNLSQKGDVDKGKLNDETRRINDRIELITNEVTRNMGDREHRLRDEFMNKFKTLEMAIQSRNGTHSDYEMEHFDNRWKQYDVDIDSIKSTISTDRAKYNERFQKINEVLALLDRNLELGNKKMDQIVTAEIQSRKLHENALLGKVNDFETKLGNYFGELHQSIEEVRAGHDHVQMPTLDSTALRREMELIAADKTKLSMEGLLKLEDKISIIQQGLNRDKRHVSATMNGMNESEELRSLKAQLRHIDGVRDDMDRVQGTIRDKVERQIPQDLNELSAKCDNLKRQLNARIEREEEERHLAVKELQDTFARLQSRLATTNDNSTDTTKRDIDECRLAIRKLAESITTVKNVLQRRLNDEIRKRETNEKRSAIDGN